MASVTWGELPAAVRAAVEERTGPVSAAGTAGEGYGSDLAAVVTARGGRVFVKGLPADDPRAWSLDTEAAISPHVRQIAPDLLWEIRAAGWIVLGFEHIDGRSYADQRPGSADLGKMLAVLRALDQIPAPDVLEVTAAQWWGQYLSDHAQAAALAGDHLVHRDPNPTNFVVTVGRAYLVDWGWAVRGPAWLNPALLVLSLLEAGWEITAAEDCAQRIPSWVTATPHAVSVFAAANAAMWDQTTAGDPDWAMRYRADVARRWAGHRAQVRDAADQ